MPGLFGELGSDVMAIAEWRPTLVFSLTEHSEMQQQGSENLGVVLANAGIDWLHLPIRDYGAPEGNSRNAWPHLAARLHKILNEGGSILCIAEAAKAVQE
jgi:protein-tyrosine phosphatase